jgi:hypothetical protein
VTASREGIHIGKAPYHWRLADALPEKVAIVEKARHPVQVENVAAYISEIVKPIWSAVIREKFGVLWTGIIVSLKVPLDALPPEMPYQTA